MKLDATILIDLIEPKEISPPWMWANFNSNGNPAWTAALISNLSPRAKKKQMLYSKFRERLN